MSCGPRLCAAACAAWMLLAATAASAQTQAPAPARAVADNPYPSVTWQDMRKEFLANAAVQFDSRVQVQGPAFAEDPMNVPISVRVSPALGPVERIVVLVDRNPIRKVLEYTPLHALPAIAFRFKLEQASAVRAAVLTKAGRWHVGSAWVDSSGGGCTVSGSTRKDGSWTQTLGDINGRLFSRTPDDEAGTSGTPNSSNAPLASSVPSTSSASSSSRLRLQIMHPMDTGLVAGVPAFYVNRLSVRDGNGRELARMLAFEPVSENPVFSFDFAGEPPKGIGIVGSDNNGNRIAGRL